MKQPLCKTVLSDTYPYSFDLLIRKRRCCWTFMSINVLPFLPLPSYFPPKGYRLKMRAVYAHFPINLVLSEEGTVVEVRNFLGEKYTRTVRLRNGVKAFTTKVKDEVVVEGNDLELVTQSGEITQRDLFPGLIVACCKSGSQ